MSAPPPRPTSASSSSR